MRWAALLTVIFIALFRAGSVLALFSFNIANADTAISSLDQVISVDLNISNLPAGDSYFRVALQKDSGTYFGYVANNSGDWSPIQTLSGDCTGYYKVNDTSLSSLSLKFKIGDTVDNGNYNLKAHRFTSTCKTNTEASNNSSYTIAVNVPTSTPTSTPTPTSANSTSTTSSSSSSFTISNIPSQVNSDQSFPVSVSLSLPNSQNTSYYLSGAFKLVDGTRYFGLTKTDAGFIPYSSSSYSNQYKITTDNSGNWNGNFEVKPDSSDSDYKGTGDYIFKVARYTEAGSQSWSNELTINITGSPTSSSSSSSSSNSSKSPTPTPSSKTSTTKTANITNSKVKINNKIASIAGMATSSASNSATPSAEVKAQKQINFIPWIGGLFILSGISSLIYMYLRAKKTA